MTIVKDQIGRETIDYDESLALATRASGAYGREITVEAGNHVEFTLFVPAWTDGSHAYTIEEYDGSSWADVDGEDIDGEYPTVTGFSAQACHFHFGYPVPSGIEKLRIKLVVSGSPSTGCTSLVTDRRRQLILIAV